MKQLAIQSPASVAHTPSVLGRVLYFASRKVNLIATLPQRLLGKWRLYLNYCPECNSLCGHTKHQCEVCHGDTKSYFAWNKEIEKTWWKRYATKHRFAA